MKRFITEKSFYRNALAIALPIALQNLIVFGVSVTDTVMLGLLGEVQLSASAQANQPQFLFALLTFGLAGGGSVLTSQYWGKKNLEAIRCIIGIILRVALVVSIVLTACVLLFPRQIMSFYLKDTAVIDEAVRYLKIVGWGYFFFGMTNTFTCIIRSVEIVKAPVYISIVSFFVNLSINYILIFGKFGAPALGIEGAAIGTLVARITEFVLICIYAFFIDKKLQFRLSYIFKRNALLLQDYIRYSIPVVCNELAWACGISLQSAILGRLSTEILSANSIASVLQQLATIAIFGLANASCVMVGKKIGQNDMEGAQSTASTMMIWSVILGALSFALVFFLRKQFAGIYNLSDETRLLTENLLIITSVLVFFVSIAATSIVGVLRGAGDTRFSLKLELITLWLVAVPVGAAAGFIFHAPVLLVYALLKIDEPLKSLIAFIRTTRPSTYKNITRADTVE